MLRVWVSALGTALAFGMPISCAFGAEEEKAVIVAVSNGGGALDGTWSGGGSVMFGSGQAEKARCRATFSKTSKFSYDVAATCATPSGKVSQTATVRGSGSNYRGTFYNADFDLTGSINITVSGRSQTVRLSSSKANAVLRLTR